ncbi:MAG: LPS export ABC transporter ATP-binding protein [Myxococcota bacterium]|nr:LPS export ABC transporter ATP-binding protein [Myxococcota bacterium]
MSQRLSGTNLVHRYGRTVAVDHVSIVVDQGEIVGLLGPNGAGKTTMFKLLAGLITPASGTIELTNRNITRWPLWRRARHGLVYIPQHASLMPTLSVSENVAAGLVRHQGQEKLKRLTELMQRFELEQIADQAARTLSGGERRRVEIVRGFAANPSFMLVDEPYAGLDPLHVNQVADALTRLADNGVGILLTDHNVLQALPRCSRVYILDQGKLLAKGRPDDISQDKRVQTRYLGVGPG